MEPFRLCLALGPVAVYLLLIGGINLSRRPLVVGGPRDAAALGLAVSGLVIVGPIELFFPEAAAITFKGYVWLLLLAFYALCLVLALLLMRPRLIIYNISTDQLRSILGNLVEQLDPDARWAGDSLALPSLGVQLHVSGMASMRNVSLVSAGPNQDHAGWRRLELALAAALEEVQVVRNPRGVSFLTAGALIILVLVMAIARDPQAIARALFDMLRL